MERKIKVANYRQESNEVYFTADTRHAFDEGIDLSTLIRELIDAQKSAGFDPYYYYGPLKVRFEGQLVTWTCYKEPNLKTHMSNTIIN